MKCQNHFLQGLRITFAWIGFLVTLCGQSHLPSEMMPLAPRRPVFGIAQAGDRFVAVGERGHILLSDDYGKSWSQVASPTRSTLTSVFFWNEMKGWAVGHANTVLHTTDGGQSWHLQYPAGHPGNSFLDVYFLDSETGFAVGAYGLFQITRDGGKQWNPVEVWEDEIHINRITMGPNGKLFMAMETGVLLVSGNEGESWDELPSPYSGSLFGILPLTRRTLICYGLRGHVFRTNDSGQQWQEVDTPVTSLITDAIRLADGTIVLAAQGGNLLLSRNAGMEFSIWNQEQTQGTAVLASTPDGAVIAGGLNGVHRLIPLREGSK